LSIIGNAGAASAADLGPRTYAKAPPPVAAAYDWSGFYAGLNGGGAWSHECITVTSDNGAPVPRTREGCHTASGGVAGGQLGYRWQMSNWVFGLEAQGDWAGLKGSNPSATATVPYTNQTNVDAIGLFTGQIGYAWNNVLGYVKGGAAVTDNQYNFFFTGSGVSIYQASETRWGSAVGAGVEVGLASSWSFAFEYDHLFMGTNNVNLQPINAVQHADDFQQDVDIATVRVNYRFGGR
jgi:outer membrane immunogenic protein